MEQFAKRKPTITTLKGQGRIEIDREDNEGDRDPKNPADVNGDGVVNILDLTLVAQGFGTDS